MSPVLEAKLPKNAITSSREEKDWYSYFDGGEPLTVGKLFQLPEFNAFLIEGNKWKWFPQKAGTARPDEARYLKEIDLIDIIDSPLLPAKNKFSVTLSIGIIKKGRPSVSDDVEI